MARDSQTHGLLQYKKNKIGTRKESCWWVHKGSGAQVEGLICVCDDAEKGRGLTGDKVKSDTSAGKKGV